LRGQTYKKHRGLQKAERFSAATALIANLGPVPLSGHEIALNRAALTFMVPLGISSAAAVRVGRQLGRGDPTRAHPWPPSGCDRLAGISTQSLNPGKQRLRSFNRSRVECIDYLLAGFRQEGAQVDSNPMDSVDPASQDLI